MTLIAAIQVAKRDLAMEEQDYRSLLERVTGKASLREMNTQEHTRVLDELRSKGAPQQPARAKGLTGPYAKKLQALWIAGWNLGIVRDRADAAMLSFIARQSGIEHTRFLRDAADAKKAVEGLKAWIAREAGVQWGSSQGRDYLQHDQGKIAWAQWRKLDPAADLGTYGGDRSFHAAVKQIVGAGFTTIGSLKPADWREVMNAFGKRVRALAGAK